MFTTVFWSYLILVYVIILVAIQGLVQFFDFPGSKEMGHETVTVQFSFATGTTTFLASGGQLYAYEV